MKKMKKKLPKTEAWVVRGIQEQKHRFEDTYWHFYPHGIVADFEFPAVGDDVFTSLYDRIPLDLYVDVEKLFEEIENNILYIHQNVLEGKTGNVEICFDEGMIHSGGNKYELCNTIAMIRVNSDYRYIFFNDGDRYDSKIFIEDDSDNAILVLKDKEKNRNSKEETIIIYLDEFYLLGICYDGKTAKEMGIMVGYRRFGNLYCDPVEEVTFSKIRELLVADWLQKKWKETKEDNEKAMESILQ